MGLVPTSPGCSGLTGASAQPVQAIATIPHLIPRPQTRSLVTPWLSPRASWAGESPEGPWHLLGQGWQFGVLSASVYRAAYEGPPFYHWRDLEERSDLNRVPQPGLPPPQQPRAGCWGLTGSWNEVPWQQEWGTEILEEHELDT